LKTDEVFILVLLQRMLVIAQEKAEELELLQYDSLELIQLKNEIKTI